MGLCSSDIVSVSLEDLHDQQRLVIARSLLKDGVTV
jgi:hypothetical protein